MAARLQNSESVTALSFVHDGSLIAGGSQTGAVHLWNAATGSSVAVVPGHSSAVSAIAVTRHGNRLASVSADRTLRVWALEPLRPVLTWEMPEPMQAVAFSPDGKAIASGGDHGSIEIREAVSGRSLRRFSVPAGSGAVRSLALSPDGRRLAAGTQSSEDVRVWEVESGRLLASLKGHSSAVTAVAFSPDGTRVISASSDRTLRVWDATHYDPLLVLRDNEDAVTSVAFSPGDAKAYSASADGVVRIWETR